MELEGNGYGIYYLPWESDGGNMDGTELMNYGFSFLSFVDGGLQYFTIPEYCMDEKSDHKVGIYCNLIGPLDQS